ncbi:MAG: hypothetical protein DHS20C15_25700 [Planctomycetota bacterium]|nr:MAG: hypothetical protein DHS20C15_25700 [Planctomycetota bacterium]
MQSMSAELHPTDEQLAQAAGQGGLPAFEALVRRHGPGVDAVLTRSLRDRHLAEDTAQEVWMKVHAALPRWQPRGSFRSWLYSVALNHLRDVARKRGRGRLVLVETPPEGVAPARPDPLEQGEVREQLERALSDVAEPYRTAVQLVDVLGLNTAEAASAMDCATGTVKSRVHRGRSLFRAALDSQPCLELRPSGEQGGAAQGASG